MILAAAARHSTFDKFVESFVKSDETTSGRLAGHQPSSNLTKVPDRSFCPCDREEFLILQADYGTGHGCGGEQCQWVVSPEKQPDSVATLTTPPVSEPDTVATCFGRICPLGPMIGTGWHTGSRLARPCVPRPLAYWDSR